MTEGSPTHDTARHANARLALGALGALGIVYGDIGTSPLYALRETFEGPGHQLPVNEANVLGVLSLVFWSLIVIISVKYLGFVMRADNEGEGGILALTSLLRPFTSGRRDAGWPLIMLGLFGTALLYGDGMITPAISVLAAVEGVAVAAPALARFTVPMAVAILAGLFTFQSRGTESVGRVFGPVMLVWFGVAALLGGLHVVQNPGVLRAVNPLHGLQFLAGGGFRAFLSLGAVFLVVTGGEALYADMGHFGRRPIAAGWFTLVLPALALNYFGQGALLLANPEAIHSPFFLLAPGWASIPLVVLATAATVIASQALISGLFSLTMQAVQLDYAPRVRIRHTSTESYGQVYIPAINWGLFVSCAGLVIGFGSSTALAAAYGVAVTATMVITTVLFAFVMHERYRWPTPAVVAMALAFLTIEMGFFVANLFKIPAGGWFPLVVGAIVFTILTTWHTGRRLVRARRRGGAPLGDYLADMAAGAAMPRRIPGTAVYLFSVPGGTPPALATSLRHLDVLHERVLVVAVVTDRVPRVPPDRRAEIVAGDGLDGICALILHYGFVESPDVPAGLAEGDAAALLDGAAPGDLTYFLSHEQIKSTDKPGMARWREHLFAGINRNATSAADYLGLPPGRVVIVGVPLEI